MEYAQWVQKVLKIPPKKRIRKFKYKKPALVSKQQNKNKAKVKKQKKKLFPYQIVEICNKNKIYTVYALKQYNSNNENKISLNDIKYWFGTWKTFKLRLDYQTSPKYKFDQKEIINLCIRFNIQRPKDFQQAHVKQPNIFPCYQWVDNHFGSWKYFKRILDACNVQNILTRYIQKKIQLGRYPSRFQCKRYKIQIEKLLQIWTPQQLNQTIELLQEIYK